jgi:hypothetical protein
MTALAVSKTLDDTYSHVEERTYNAWLQPSCLQVLVTNALLQCNGMELCRKRIKPA